LKSIEVYSRSVALYASGISKAKNKKEFEDAVNLVKRECDRAILNFNKVMSQYK